MHIIKPVSDMLKPLCEAHGPSRDGYFDNEFGSGNLYGLPKGHLMSLRDISIIKPRKPSSKFLKPSQSVLFPQDIFESEPAALSTQSAV